jgi:hypothetical protein
MVVQVPEGSVLDLGNRNDVAHIRLRHVVAMEQEATSGEDVGGSGEGGTTAGEHAASPGAGS